MKISAVVIWALVFAFSIAAGLDRGGFDFDVFRTAGQHLIDGTFAQIYRQSPDRYLYAPGFAFVFAPFALIPRSVGFVLWSLIKGLLFISILRGDQKEFKLSRLLGTMILIRPMMIDLQYGQINLPMVWAAFCALTFKSRDRRGQAAWIFLTVLAWSKLILLPLLAIPFFAILGDGRDDFKKARWLVVLVSLVFLSTPFIMSGGVGGQAIYSDWIQALIARGFPLESHNQSLAAILHHLLSGSPVHIIAQGSVPVQPFGDLPWTLSPEMLQGLSKAGSLLALSWLLIRIAGYQARPSNSRVARLADGICIASLILPLHLIWKTYFVFGLPLVAELAAAQEALTTRRPRAARLLALVLVAAGVLINLTSFEFIGSRLAGQMESAGVMFAVHLVLIVAAVLTSRRLQNMQQLRDYCT